MKTQQSIIRISQKLKIMNEHEDQDEDHFTEHDLADHNHQAPDATGNQQVQHEQQVTQQEQQEQQDQIANHENSNTTAMQTTPDQVDNTDQNGDHLTEDDLAHHNHQAPDASGNQQVQHVQQQVTHQEQQHQQDQMANQENSNTTAMQTTPDQSQSESQALSVEDKNSFLTDMNNELEQENSQLRQEIAQLKEQLQQSLTNQTSTPQKKPPANSIYRNLMNSPPASTSSSSSSSSSNFSINAAIGDIQQCQTQVASAFEQELEKARNNLQDADNERYELAKCVDNFMLTNTSLWHIFMDLSQIVKQLQQHPKVHLARNHIGLLEVSSSYINIRMLVNQIDTNMKTSNIDYRTHQVPLLNNVIQNVTNMYNILQHFHDGSILPDLPRALKMRGQYVNELSTICERAIANPQILPTLHQTMRTLTRVMGESLHQFQKQR